MSSIHVFWLAPAMVLLCSFGPSRCVLAGQQDTVVVTSESPGIRFVAVDGHSLSSLQQQIKISPGRHVIVFRANLALVGGEVPPDYSPEADATLDTTFEANHQYTFQVKLSDGGLLKGNLIDLTAK